MEQQLSIMVLGENGPMVDEVSAALQSSPFAVQTSVTPSLDQIKAHGDHDAYIVCLPPGFQPMQENRHGSAIPPHANVLFAATGSYDAVRKWAYPQGASDVLSWPLSDAELQHRVGASILADADQFHKSLTEDNMIAYLRNLLDRGITTVSPSLDASMPNGVFYPAASAAFGRSPYHTVVLEQMAASGVLSRKVVNRIRACNACNSAQLNYREVCSSCGSVDLSRKDTLHHFSCGHVAAMDDFRSGSGLQCPKCSAVVRHIGVDYEKLSIHFDCNQCGHLSPEPRIETECMRCTTVAAPQDTLSRPVNEYTLTEMASVAVEEGRLSGLNLETVLRGGNLGLYTAQYFEHELSREMTRSKRYKTPYCVMLIRLDNLDAVRSKHAEKAYDYINQVFEALSEGLRVLDTTCVWNSDTLGVLLSSTPLEGAKVVVDKMQQNVKALEHLVTIQEPSITVCLASEKDEHESAEAAIAAIEAELTS